LHSLNFVIILKQTGRYENKNVNERVCFICHDQIEYEKHVLLYCPLYADLRERLFNEVKRSNVHFIILSDDKFIYLFKRHLHSCFHNDLFLFAEESHHT
jgi:hypothetical protein